MYKKILQTGGEEIKLDDIFIQAESSQEILKYMGLAMSVQDEYDSVVSRNGKISGCSYITAGGNHTITKGFVFYNGEIYTVPSQVVSSGSAANLYYFLPSVQNIRPKTFADLTVKSTYQYLTGSWQTSDTSSGIRLSDKTIISQYSVPRGVIVAWSGQFADIPSGWAFCDGTNGTPNLTGRFLLNFGIPPLNIGDIGGAQSVALSSSEMPAHRHYVANNDVGTNAVTNTTHITKTYSSSAPYEDASYVLTGTATEPDRGLTSSTGSGGYHDNMPPYYVLAYIMKL